MDTLEQGAGVLGGRGGGANLTQGAQLGNLALVLFKQARVLNDNRDLVGNRLTEANRVLVKFAGGKAKETEGAGDDGADH